MFQPATSDAANSLAASPQRTAAELFAMCPDLIEWMNDPTAAALGPPLQPSCAGHGYAVLRAAARGADSVRIYGDMTEALVMELGIAHEAVGHLPFVVTASKESLNFTCFVAQVKFVPEANQVLAYSISERNVLDMLQADLDWRSAS